MVFIGSRNLERAKMAAESILRTAGPTANVIGLLNEEATAKADVVVVTVPFSALGETLKTVKPSLRPGQIVVNVTVPLETAIGGKPTHTIGVWAGSAGELAATMVPKGVKVVSAFNNVSAELLSDISHQVECDILICGADDDAKQVVMELARAISGARPLDAGPLENSRIIEQLTALLVSLNMRHGVKTAGLRITGINSNR